MPGKRTMTIQTQTPGVQKPPTRAPEVGDWIKFRDWGSESIGEVTGRRRGFLIVRLPGAESLHVAYGPDSVLEIRKPERAR